MFIVVLKKKLKKDMAKLEITSNEIVTLANKFAKKEMEEYIHNLEADKDAFKFTLAPDLDIPLINLNVPLKIQFLGYKDDALVLQVTVDSSITFANLLVNGLVKAIQKLFIKDEIVDGVILEGNVAHIHINKFLDGQALITEIKSEENKFTVVAEV